MAGEEREALGVFFKQHFAQIAVAETDLAAIRDGAGDAERLQAFADRGGSLGRLAAALLDGDRGAYGVCPLGVFKADRLDVFDHVVHVQTGVFRDLFGLFDGADAVFGELFEDLFFSSVVGFKLYHHSFPPIILFSDRSSGRRPPRGRTGRRLFRALPAHRDLP